MAERVSGSEDMAAVFVWVSAPAVRRPAAGLNQRRWTAGLVLVQVT